MSLNNSSLNKIFVYVPSAEVATFKTGAGLTNAYKNRISFLGGTGEIMTNGEIFAINRNTDIQALQDLLGTDSSSIATDLGFNATTIVGAIKTVYDLANDNYTELDGRLDTLEGTGEGSVRKAVDDAVAALVAQAPSSFDTLKEIADWIQADAQNQNGFDAANRILTLETKVGDASVAAENYTAAEAAEYNANLTGALNDEEQLSAEEAALYNAAIDGANKEAGDTLTSEEADAYNATLDGAKTTDDVKTPAIASTGLYASIDNLQSQIDVISGGGAGSIQQQITSNINLLDSSITLGGTTSAQPQNVNIDTTIDVLGSVTISETDGKIDAEAAGKSAKLVLQADAAGAARKAYDVLYGDVNTDTTDSMTLIGLRSRIDDKSTTGTFSVSTNPAHTVEFTGESTYLVNGTNLAYTLNSIEMWETYSAN